MQNKKTLNFFFLSIAMILGTVLIRQFDFSTLRFEHTGLAILYGIVFICAVYFLFKGYRKRAEE